MTNRTPCGTVLPPPSRSMLRVSSFILLGENLLRIFLISLFSPFIWNFGHVVPATTVVVVFGSACS